MALKKLGIWTTLVASLVCSRPCIKCLQGLLSVRHTISSLDGTSTQNQADVIIVFGYALFRNGSATNPLKARVDAGVDAWQKGFGANLIFSGAYPSRISGYITGGGKRNKSEAQVMLEHGMQRLERSRKQVAHQPESWLLEEQSTSTVENALHSLDIMKQKGWSSALLATNTFHQRRTLLTFQRVASDLGIHCQVGVLEVPFAGHRWGLGFLVDNAMDLLDFVRELAAFVYNMKVIF
mmetsp:Transcript_18986/g.53178  ORF Transcript_18986/g.53178 Transcript_18986/m.53178 type:complete len:237 (+) Transcript_18986:207-917(+)|eukprot:CAMPEP_0202337800 /NCGR_PEP_ID=MMETSP1126-20121109/341_1 /ASSEMBLY_ACC=CAM_ASM_000457 /TAXON_ID=3047 /ORGANISM="Dunaliella tertiolecta, Strain CCMP1320" /LENGTH=236 /DNA_ID=CAMNT_0048928071 /DNA_START=192 /DNA_END=902 /DNA_ORIENTATION=-